MVRRILIPIPSRVLGIPAARPGGCGAGMGKYGESKHLPCASQALVGRPPFCWGSSGALT